MKPIKIKSINKTHYRGMVHNLAVEGDETFFAGNILVHNCRSILIPVFVGDDELEGGSYQDYKKDMSEWGDGVSPENKWPADGFGRPTGA